MNTARPLSRRTFARAAAWSAPAISVAVAAPAYARSGAAVVGITTSGTWAQSEAGNRYSLVVTIANQSSSDLAAGAVTFDLLWAATNLTGMRISFITGINGAVSGPGDSASTALSGASATWTITPTSAVPSGTSLAVEITFVVALSLVTGDSDIAVTPSLSGQGIPAGSTTDLSLANFVASAPTVEIDPF